MMDIKVNFFLSVHLEESLKASLQWEWGGCIGNTVYVIDGHAFIRVKKFFIQTPVFAGVWIIVLEAEVVGNQGEELF